MADQSSGNGAKFVANQSGDPVSKVRTLADHAVSAVPPWAAPASRSLDQLDAIAVIAAQRGGDPSTTIIRTATVP